MANYVKYPEDWDFYNDRPAKENPMSYKDVTSLCSSQGNLPSEPSWIPNTHHVVPQPAGHECAQWYEWANPSACEILYALAHTKGERDRLGERVAELEHSLTECYQELYRYEVGHQPTMIAERARILLDKEHP